MDFQKRIEYSKYKTMNSDIYKYLPKYLSSKHRVHNLFFKRCENEIDIYQTCINDSNW